MFFALRCRVASLLCLRRLVVLAAVAVLKVLRVAPSLLSAQRVSVAVCATLDVVVVRVLHGRCSYAVTLMSPVLVSPVFTVACSDAMFFALLRQC